MILICDNKHVMCTKIKSVAVANNCGAMEADTIIKNGGSSKSLTKKFLGFLLMVMIGFAACEGPMGPEGPAGVDGIDGRNGEDGTNGRNGRDGTDGKDGVSTNWYIVNCIVSTNHWRPVSDDLMGNIFEYEFQIPELTKFIFDEGTVVCHLIQYLNSEPFQTPLPYTFYGDDNGYFYSENYTYEIRPGFINFIVKISDFNTQAQQPLSCTFRITMMW